jgi:Transposase DDE domain group 1
LDYVVAMAKNAVLNRLAGPLMQQARQLAAESAQSEHLYGQGRYAAQSRLFERRVIFKAEVVRQPGKEAKDNPRFVIPNRKQRPQWI